MSADLGISVNETKELFQKHAQEMPFVSELSRECQNVVRKRGYLRSLLKRHVRFPYAEPTRYDARVPGELLTWEEAKVRWKDEKLVHARLYKALNSLIQPSAADQTKAAMLAVWKSDLGKTVMIQVHDELCCSIEKSADNDRLKEIMKNAVPFVPDPKPGRTEPFLSVPSKVTTEVNEAWSGQ